MLRRYSFNRYELKYLVHEDQAAALFEDIAGRTVPDEHAGGDGCYRIASVYLDSPDLRCYWEKVDGEKYRRKVRLRTYCDAEGRPTDALFLEIKQRINRTVQKRRAPMALDAARRFLREGEIPSLDQQRHVLDEVDYLMRRCDLEPKLVVSYLRRAYFGRYDQDLRITADYHVKCRSTALDLGDGTWGEYMIEPHLVVLEVKINERIPLWLSLVLGQHGITSTRISKYCRGVQVALRD